MPMRIGIDVGGTHTDAVLLDGDELVASTKALTSADVTSGILEALEIVLGDAGIDAANVAAVMLGTTQFTNAVVERRELAEVAAIRLGLPSGEGVPPMIGWPDDIAAALGGQVYQLGGGYLYDGQPLSALDDADIDAVVEDIRGKGLRSVAIASPFSPMNAEPELHVAERLRRAIPDARITCSHRIGRIGLLERENAAILNAALLDFADRVVDAFRSAFRQRQLDARFFVSQNDGTLMDAEFVRQYPALTFASGPTNSLRGACRLTGLKDAIVVDIGGTTSDIGVLQDGFPRESNVVIEVGGVRTNFRMPDVLAVGLGGGSLVSADGSRVGPQSVGHRLVSEGLVFGGDTLTATDLVVAAGDADIGDASRVAGLDRALVDAGIDALHTLLEQNIERMKPSGRAMPVVLVGGGAVLVSRPLANAPELLRPENAGVANAIGAAIAQIGGEAERLIAYTELPREEAIRQVSDEARSLAAAAGADPATVRIAEVDETSVAYLTDGTTRVRVKAVGDIAGLGARA
ncbi:MAG: hydantoinase/oxoprolinase family protein [Woeseiaceae bacterium]|nr:hydantoinase/oxoprolinase family protein [Woeseiaceae bacterium]